MKNKIILILSFSLFIPTDILFLYSKNREIIKKDLEKYCIETPYKKANIFAYSFCMFIIKPFRNIFIVE